MRQEGGVLHGGTWRTFMVPDRVILDMMDVLCSPQGPYPENFMLILALEVCQEGGVL